MVIFFFFFFATQHVGSVSSAKDGNCTLCSGNVESKPLDYQGSPGQFLFFSFFLVNFYLIYLMFLNFFARAQKTEKQMILNG